MMEPFLSKRCSHLIIDCLFFSDSIGGSQQEIKFVPKSCCVYDENIRGYRDLKKCQSWSLGPPGNLKNNLKNDALYYEVSGSMFVVLFL